MMTKPTRPSILKRLAATAPVECAIACASVLLAGLGLQSYFEFQSAPLADQVTPLAFMFGVWPFIMLAGVAIGFAVWAVEKAK